MGVPPPPEFRERLPKIPTQRQAPKTGDGALGFIGVHSTLLQLEDDSMTIFAEGLLGLLIQSGTEKISELTVS